MTKDAADAAWRPFIRRSIVDYYRLPPETRAEVLTMIRGRARRPSQKAMRWWGALPGLPRHNRAVFAVIRNFRVI